MIPFSGGSPSCNKSIFFFPLKVNTVGKGAAFCGRNDIKTAAISAKIRIARQFLINIRKKRPKKDNKKEIKAKNRANAVVGHNNIFTRLSVVIYAASPLYTAQCAVYSGKMRSIFLLFFRVYAD